MFLKRLLMAAAFAAVTLPAAAFEPTNPECIAPANPGGGWDFTCRTFGRLLSEEKLVPGTVQVTNMPGAVGALAFANVASKRNDDPNLIVATSTVAMAQIAQGKYPAGVDAMRWVGMLGADVGAVLVPKDSEFGSLDALLEAMQTNPSGIIAGGSSSIGGWDHLRLLMLAQEAGVPMEKLKDIRWVQFEGGGDAVTQLLGGQLNVVLTDVGEIGGFIQSGDVNALAVMSQDRLEAYPEVQTAQEQGIDVEGYNWRGVYVGGEVSDEAYQGWVDIMQKLYETDAWKEAATQSGLTPIWRGGDEFEAFVRESETRMEELSRAIGVIQ
ncbi:tripartite tricarboxylate transporter substrate-binding protein [Aurantimonas sp. A2-1-M11]|uniref:Bug family tripartite tricarboxylate transporter substrate binding protein n=1 Tax=Aurantimonas sp. A2-1-M11 TaxID=3113712 RepID=UPI002F9528C8